MRIRVEEASFVIRWDTHCFECERGIHRGTKCRVDDQGRAQHFTCPSTRVDDPSQACPTCHLTICDGH